MGAVGRGKVLSTNSVMMVISEEVPENAHQDPDQD